MTIFPTQILVNKEIGADTLLLGVFYADRYAQYFIASCRVMAATV